MSRILKPIPRTLANNVVILDGGYPCCERCRKMLGNGDTGLASWGRYLHPEGHEECVRSDKIVNPGRGSFRGLRKLDELSLAKKYPPDEEELERFERRRAREECHYYERMKERRQEPHPNRSWRIPVEVTPEAWFNRFGDGYRNPRLIAALLALVAFDTIAEQQDSTEKKDKKQNNGSAAPSPLFAVLKDFAAATWREPFGRPPTWGKADDKRLEDLRKQPAATEPEFKTRWRRYVTRFDPFYERQGVQSPVLLPELR